MESTVFEKYAAMEAIWNDFKSNHNTYSEKGNKAAAGRARKAINELKKHITAYKQASVEHVKSN
jgi:hypothetical protein